MKKENSNALAFSSSIYFCKDKKFNYTFANQSYLNFIGEKSIDSLLGKNDFHLPSEKYAKEYQKHDKEAMDRQCYRIIEPVIDGNNHENYVITFKQPQYDRNQQCIGVACEAAILPVKKSTSILLNLIISSCSSSIKVNSQLYNYYCEGHLSTRLSKRECEVFYYVLHGNTGKKIASILNLSRRTVEGYIEVLKDKLCCASRSDLVELGHHLGLIEVVPVEVIFRKFYK